VIPEIDIWRIAYLMLKRYGDEADIETRYGPKSLLRRAIRLARRSGGGLLARSVS